jgi:vacuolar-type H+-ATPase subunit F/Vma7
MKGIIHVHTKEFSYDGKINFQEIKEFCKKMGFSFVALTEHSANMNKNKMKELVRKCKKMSDKKVLFIPGLEFLTKEGYEVLGLGVKKFLQKSSLKETVNFIRKNKGVAILAHPCKYKNLPKNLDVDGVEILNFEYDGFFPCPIALKFFEKLEQKNKNVFGIFGLDIHRKIHFRNIFIEINCKMSEKEIIKKLREKRFLNRTSFINLSSRPKVSGILLLLYHLWKNFFTVAKMLGIIIFKTLRKLRKEVL